MKGNAEGGAVVGMTLMVLASVVRVALQMLIFPVIGRILGPHAYGLIALVSPFVFFSMLLAESGLGASIVRSHVLTEAFEGTVLSFSAGFSLLTILLFSVLAYPMGHLLGEPTFPPLLIGMSSILLIASFNVVPAARLAREKKYTWVALGDIASSLGGIIGVIIGIALKWGPWSLVAQQICFWTCKVVVVMIGSHYRPHLAFRWAYIRENMYFSAHILGTSILTFIAFNIDNVLIGTFMGSETLGYYALAFQIAGIAQMVIAGSVYYAMFSQASAAQRLGNFTATPFLQALRGTLLLSAPVTVGLAVTSPLFIPLVMGERWMPSVLLIMLLAPFGLCQTIGAAVGGLMTGLGRSDLIFRITLFNALAIILAILLGVYNHSVATVACGVSVATVIGYIVLLHITARECHVNFGKIIEVVAAPLIASLAMGCAVYGLNQSMPASLDVLGRLAICVVAGVVVYAAILFTCFRQALAADTNYIIGIIAGRLQKIKKSSATQKT